MSGREERAPGDALPFRNVTVTETLTPPWKNHIYNKNGKSYLQHSAPKSSIPNVTVIMYIFIYSLCKPSHSFQLKVALFLDLTAEDVRIYYSAARILRAVSCFLEKGNIFPVYDRFAMSAWEIRLSLPQRTSQLSTKGGRSRRKGGFPSRDLDFHALYPAVIGIDGWVTFFNYRRRMKRGRMKTRRRSDNRDRVQRGSRK